MDDDHDRAWAQSLIEAQPSVGEPGVIEWLQRLCRAAAQTVDVAAATVTVGAPNDTFAVVAASDPTHRRFAEAEYAVGEGPAHDAWAHRRPVLVPELGGPQDGAWPGYTTAAASVGIVAVFAFPLQVGAARVGTLTLYHHQPGRLAPSDLATCLVMAELATERLIDSTSEDLQPTLNDAVAFRSEIYQAQGMVAVAHGVSLIDGLATIRGHAFQTGRDLIDVAIDIVHNGYRFGDDRQDRTQGQGPDQE